MMYVGDTHVIIHFCVHSVKAFVHSVKADSFLIINLQTRRDKVHSIYMLHVTSFIVTVLNLCLHPRSSRDYCFQCL